MTTPNYPASPPSSGVSTPASGTSAGTSTGAASTGDAAKEQAQQAAGAAADESKHVAGVAKDEAKQVVGEAKQQVQNLMQDAKSQVDQQSRTQRDRLVSTLQDFSEHLDGMARGEGAPSGLAQDAVTQVADGARTISSRIEGREPSDLLEEVRAYARRRPGTFLLGAMAAGLVAGRLMSGAKQAQSGDTAGNGGSNGASPHDDVHRASTRPPASGVGFPATDPVNPSANIGQMSPPRAGTTAADPGVRQGSLAADPVLPVTGTTAGRTTNVDPSLSGRAGEREVR